MDQYDKEQAEEEEESSTSIKNTSMMHHDEEAFQVDPSIPELHLEALVQCLFNIQCE